MSEKFKNIPDELKQLDVAMVDPVINDVLQQAREYGELLRGAQLNEKERLEIQNELDSQWGVLRGARFTLSGHVSTLLHGESEPRRRYVDDISVVSDGFIIYKDKSIVLDDEVLESHAIAHYLSASLADTFPEVFEENGREIDPSVKVVVFADVDDVDMQADGVSFERASAWISLSAPALIEEIESRILGDHDGEDGALLSLRGLDPSAYGDLSDEFTRKCLAVYLYHVLEFDTDVPYLANLHGFARVAHRNGEGYALSDVSLDDALVTIHETSLHPEFAPSEDGEVVDRWTLGVSMSLHLARRNDDAVYVTIPVDTLADLKSIRRTTYENKD